MGSLRHRGALLALGLFGNSGGAKFCHPKLTCVLGNTLTRAEGR